MQLVKQPSHVTDCRKVICVDWETFYETGEKNLVPG